MQKQHGYRRPDSAVTEAVNFSRQPKDLKAKTCQSGGKKKKKGQLNIPNKVRQVPRAKRPGQLFLHPQSGPLLKSKSMKS